MQSRYRFAESNAAYFVTCTTVEWLPVFSRQATCYVLVKSLLYCREQKNMRIYAWVIMDNHFHAILSATGLSAIMQQLKSFTAKQIIGHLQSDSRDWLLNQLRFYAKGSVEHQLWKEGSHPQAILDDEMMLQKMEYLHNNPVRRGWVASPEHWRYSSAHEWLPGATPLLRCDQWR